MTSSPDGDTEDPSQGGDVELEPAAAMQVFGDRIDLARQYVLALATDGVLRGLIGPRESGRLWTRHVLNSGVVGPLLGAGAAVVDVGTGAGLPGIPLAIARPDCRVALVEPLERRTIFLQEMVDQLGLSNCRVVRGRADQVIDECGGADLVTSRAVAPLAKLSVWSAPLLRIGGQLLALKGASATEEIERDRPAVAAAGLIDLAVVTAGAGLVDPPTVLVSATRVALGGKRSRGGARRGR
jgi:16S rRNA (guanine527-N7)-methyltransferase